MNIKILPFICGSLLTLGVFGQDNETTRMLMQIAQNNSQLKAYRSYMESRQLEHKSQNNLPDPQFSAFYLPFGTHTTGSYAEFQISQTFAFPTVYTSTKKSIEKQEEQLALEFEELRQEVLLTAKKHYMQLVFLEQKKAVEAVRAAQAKQVYEQVQKLFNAGQTGILDVNKAKIAWIQDQFVMEQLETEIGNTMLELQQLNGGEALSINPESYPDDMVIDPMETLWEHKTQNDPGLKALAAREALALQRIKLEQNKALPDITAGYNYQGFATENYSGFYGGISIPLWKSRNTVKAARADHTFQQLQTQTATATLYAQFQKQYHQYQLLLKKFREYENTLKNLNGEALLYKAYELGQISFMEYYTELLFYRNAFDTMLHMQKELHVHKASLLKHQL